MNDVSFVISVFIGLIVWTVLIIALVETVRDFIDERKNRSCNTCRYRELYKDNDVSDSKGRGT